MRTWNDQTVSSAPVQQVPGHERGALSGEPSRDIDLRGSRAASTAIGGTSPLSGS